VLTEHDVRASLDTDDRVHRMFLNDEFDVWAIGQDAVAKFARTDIDAAKIPSVDGAAARALGAGERTLSFDVPQLTDAALARTAEIAGDAVERFISTPPPEPSVAERSAIPTSRASTSSWTRTIAG
jgi:hypothetical protein